MSGASGGRDEHGSYVACAGGALGLCRGRVHLACVGLAPTGSASQPTANFLCTLCRNNGAAAEVSAYADGALSFVEVDQGRDHCGGGKSGGLSEGDTVEADYEGRGEHYKGKISRDRGDGTFDIDYDDGETELRVRETLIRPLTGGGENVAQSPSETSAGEARARGAAKMPLIGRVVRVYDSRLVPNARLTKPASARASRLFSRAARILSAPKHSKRERAACLGVPQKGVVGRARAVDDRIPKLLPCVK